MLHHPSLLCSLKSGLGAGEALCVYTRVQDTRLWAGRMGWEPCSGPVHPPLGRWDLFGSAEPSYAK